MALKLLKGTKIYSIITGNCPVCHNESMYTESNPFFVTKTLIMKERCSHCNTKYKIEPSFFFGAMYVSYPVGLIFGGIAFAIAYLVFNLSLLNSYLTIVLVMIISLPIILRISRNIWINIFMGYNKNKSNKSLNT